MANNNNNQKELDKKDEEIVGYLNREKYNSISFMKSGAADLQRYGWYPQTNNTIFGNVERAKRDYIKLVQDERFAPVQYSTPSRDPQGRLIAFEQYKIDFAELEKKYAAVLREASTVNDIKNAENKVSSPWATLGGAWRSRNGYNEAIVKMELEMSNMANDPAINWHDRTIAFLADYKERLRKMKIEITETLLKESFRNAKENAVGALRTAEAYFVGHPGQAMDYYEKGLNHFKSVQNDPTFRDSPLLVADFAAFLVDFEKKREKFFKLYMDTTLTKRARGHIDTSNQKLSQANHSLQYDEGKALELFSEAKKEAAVLAGDKELAGMEIVKEFSVKFEKESAAFVEKFENTVIDKEIKTNSGLIDYHLGLAGSNLHFFKFEEAQEQFLMAINAFNAFKKNERLAQAKPEQVKTIISTSTTKIAELKAQIQEKLAKDQLQKLTGDITTKYYVANANIQSNGCQFDTGVEQIQRLRLAIAELKASAMTDSDESMWNDAAKAEIESFSNEFFKKTSDLETELKKKMETDQWRTLTNNFATYDAHVNSHMHFYKYEEAAESIHKLEIALEEAEQSHLVTSPNIASEAQEFIKKSKQIVEKWREEYAEKVLGEELKKIIGNANHNLHLAIHSFENHQENNTKDYLNKAETAAAELATDSRFSSLKQTEEFFKEFSSKCEDLRVKYSAYLRGLPVIEYKNSIDHLLHLSKTQWTVNKEDSLEKLELAQTKLRLFEASLSEALYPASEITEIKNWILERSKTADTLKQQYADALFKQEIEDQKKKCSGYISDADYKVGRGDFAGVSVALECARKLGQALSTNPSYFGVVAVDEYLKTSAESIKKVELKLEEALAKGQLKEWTDRLDGNIHLIKHYFGIGQLGSCLDEILKARVKISEPQEIVSRNADLVKQKMAVIEEYEEKLNKQLFENEISTILKGAESSLSTAEVLLRNNSAVSALETFNFAVNTIDAIASDPKYLNVEALTAALKTWNERINAWRATYTENVTGDAIREMQSSVKHNLHLATTFHQQASVDFSQVAQYLNVAQQNLATLMSTYGHVPSVVKFETETKQEIEKLMAKVGESLFKEELEGIKKVVDHQIFLAKQYLDRHAYQQATETYLIAKKKAQELNDPKFASKKDLISQYNTEFDKFAKTVAEKYLADDADRVFSKIRTLLSEASLLKSRVLASPGLVAPQPWYEKLLEARKHAQEEIQDPLKLLGSHPESVKVLSDISAQETEYCKYLTKEIEGQISNAKKGVEKVNVLLTRGARKAAAEELGKVLEAFTYSNDPVVKNDSQVKEVVSVVLAPLKVQLKDLLSTTETKGKSSTTAQASGDYGDFIKLAFPAFEFTLPVFPVTIDTPPALMTPLKTYNEAARDIRGYAPSFMAGLQSLHKYIPSEPFKDLGRFFAKFKLGDGMKGYGEISGNLAKIKKSALPELEKMKETSTVAKEAIEAYEKLKTEFDAMTSRWTKFNNAMSDIQDVCEMFEIVEQGVEIMSKGGAYQYGYKLFSTPPSMNPFIKCRSLLIRDHLDSDFYLTVIDHIHDITDKINVIESQYSAKFPKKEETLKRVEELRKLAIHKHPEHCFFYALNLRDESGLDYVKALNRFPKCRQWLPKAFEVITELNEVDYDTHKKRNQYAKLLNYLKQEYTEPSNVIKEETWFPSIVSDRIKPGDFLAADGKPVVATDRKVGASETWNDKQKALAGKIIFSKKKIPVEGLSDSDYSITFNGADEIFGRAFWPTVINRLPLGKTPEGKPIFGPKYLSGHGQQRLEMLLFVTINGKPQEQLVEMIPNGALCHFFDASNSYSDDAQLGTKIDFWAYNQSCVIRVFENQIEDWSDRWNVGAQRLKALIKQLGSGKHSVKLELKYRVRAQPHFYKPEVSFPQINTDISVPIAVGEFTVDCGASPVKLGRITPVRTVRKLSSSEADKIEKEIKEWLTKSRGWGSRSPKNERVVSVVLTGDWYSYQEEVLRRENFDRWVKTVVVHHNISFKAVFYRSPKDGWYGVPRVVGFDLAAIVSDTPVGGKPELPIEHVAVGGLQSEFEIELLPEDVVLPQL